MPEWKREIKRLANDFFITTLKVNQIIKDVECSYSQRKMPSYYKGNQDEYLYDAAQKEIMKIVYA